ncbi:MAG: hypothetical protein QM771_04865 [Nitrospira sp.]
MMRTLFSLGVMAVGLTLAGCMNQEIHEYSPKWDSWMGSTKDDRIKEMGIPTRCHSFKDGGEVCEWIDPAAGRPAGFDRPDL